MNFYIKFEWSCFNCVCNCARMLLFLQFNSNTNSISHQIYLILIVVTVMDNQTHLISTTIIHMYCCVAWKVHGVAGTVHCVTLKLIVFYLSINFVSL
jgi:hypothetical protein